MSTRYHIVDHFRGLACLMVVVHHSTSAAARESVFGFEPDLGAVGVHMFFCISGYCITAAVAAARKRKESLAGFMKRRMRRIYPPYWVACACVWATLSSFTFLDTPNAEIVSFWQVFGNFTLTETWRALLVGPPPEFIMSQAWTLCYEEQFYLVCGLLLLAPSRWYLPVACALCVVTTLVSASHLEESLNGLFIVFYWLSFAPGVFLFYSLHGTTAERRVAAFGLAVSLALGSIVNTIGCATALAILLWSLHRWDSAINSWQGLHWLRWCGVISYSLYLVHAIPCKFIERFIGEARYQESLWAFGVSVPAAMVVSLSIAWPFHILIERRFMPSPAAIETVPRSF